MPLHSRDVAAKLIDKFHFALHEGDHLFFVRELAGGKRLRTKVSHGRHELSAQLEAEMARQLRVPVPFFRLMISCTRSNEDFENQVLSAPTRPWSDHSY